MYLIVLCTYIVNFSVEVFSAAENLLPSWNESNFNFFISALIVYFLINLFNNIFKLFSSAELLLLSLQMVGVKKQCD